VADPIHPELIEAARLGEPDRYVAALLAPAAARPGLIALAAFCAELRRIPRLVREPMMGEMRLQWWRDVLAAAPSTGPIGHPLADALTATVADYRLPVPILTAMTEGRAFDLYRDPMPDRATLEAYLGKLDGAHAELALRILADGSGAADAGSLAVANSAGRIYGLSRLLYDLPDWLGRGHTPLPSDLVDGAAGGQDAPAEVDWPHVAAGIGALADDAEMRAGPTWRSAAVWPAALRNCVLPLAMVRPYARAARQMAADGFRVRHEVVPIGRMWRLARARWLGL
jgi:phytoene synthase